MTTNNPTSLTKIPNHVFIKHDVSEQEYKIHKYVVNLGVPAPKVYYYDRKTKTMAMQKLPGMSVSGYYGEDPDNVPEHVFTQIRKILKTLYMNNIEYPDITGYNFMVRNNKIHIIDFGHATCCDEYPTDAFMLKFLNSHNGWNPEFA